MLHTSDWHLGRNFGPVSLQADQEAFVEWLLDVVAQEAVDLVVVAGDLFDRAIPPTESVALLRHAFTALAARGVRVVAIAGNHDSAERVAAADGLTDAAGVFVRGGYLNAGVTTTLGFADGPLDIVAVPYLDPLLSPGLPSRGGSPRPTHQSVLGDAVARYRPASPRSVAVAHAFVAGATPSESERALTVGASPRVATTTFDGFSYVALGHLHEPQVVGGDPTRRYSGAPLPYSFSEQRAKQVLVADLDAAGGCAVVAIDVPVGRRAVTITGDLDELLSEPGHARFEQCFVRAIVTDSGHVLDAKARLRERFEFVTEVVLRPPPGAGALAESPDKVVARTAMRPIDAACAFWRDVTGGDPTDPEQHLLREMLERAALVEQAR